MTWNLNLAPMLITSILCLSWAVNPLMGVDDHRVVLLIDKKITIAPAGTPKRGMMSMVRHPDGTIYLNFQTEMPTLYKSSDNAENWKAVPVTLAQPHQVVQGLGANRAGRLFLVHQTAGDKPPNVPKKLYGQDLFVSYSDDGGGTWVTSQTDFRGFPPGTPNIKYHEDGIRTFIEQPDGTLMFTTTIVPAQEYQKQYPPRKPIGPPNYEYGGQPGDLFSDVVFRSTDGGVTWGDPSQVYPNLNPHETALAIDPHDDNHILVMTRIQRLGRPEEDAEEMMKRTGNPLHYYKQGALFESADGGRTFELAKGGMTDWYGHRGTIYWSPSNVVVVTHSGGGRDSRKVARISLDGAKTWVDETKSGTPFMNQSTKWVVDQDTSFSCPTVERSPDHFFSAIWRYVGDGGEILGVFWHLERPYQEWAEE
jgi:hypothetical protein